MHTSSHTPSGKRHRRSRRSSRALKRRLVWVIAALVLTGSAIAAYRTYHKASTPAAVWFEKSAAHKPLVDLPKDDAPHETGMEWWYYNGHLKTPDGRVFSFHDVVFIVGGITQQMVSHLSFTDHQTGKHYINQRRTTPPYIADDDKGFDFKVGGWEMAGVGGKDRLKAATPEFAFDLKLEDSTPPVLHGGTGLLDFRQGGTSYYYSRTRMPAKGTLTYGGKVNPVAGEIWFDHQWGDFSPTLFRYNWFSLQLKGGVDIMLYLLTDLDGKTLLNAGTFVQNGRVEDLKEGEFKADALSLWTSPATGIHYPLNWRLLVPKKAIDILVTPVIESSEFDARTTTFNVYWEGAVRVTGSHPGAGFLEISPHEKKRNRETQGQSTRKN